MNLCSSQTSTWPPSTNNDNQVGKTVSIHANYTFQSALAMYAPGSGAVSFGTVIFPGDSRQVILFYLGSQNISLNY